MSEAHAAGGSPTAVSQRITSPRMAMKAVPAGSRVAASPYCSTPTTLLDALAVRANEVAGISLSAGLLLGDLGFLDSVVDGALSYRTWHLGGPSRQVSHLAGLDYVPLRARDVPGYLSSRVDVALARVTPPDAAGNCSLGPSASYTRAMLSSARIRIAEVDPHLPRTRGRDVTYPYSGFDIVVDSEQPMAMYPPSPSSPTAAAIAHHVVPILRDGVTLQLGIGKVPEEIAHALAHSDVRDLSLVGMMTDAMVDLAQHGRLTTRPNAIEAVELLGTRRVFDFAHDNEAILMHSSTVIHDATWLGTHPSLVSVCSALAVDLTGQVASEEIDGRMISGVGGSIDFFEGAHGSHGGLRVIALSATTPSGASRIVSMLPARTPVTVPRHSVDYVVTEFGVAHLAERSLRERAAALVAIAAPEFRTALSESGPYPPSRETQ